MIKILNYVNGTLTADADVSSLVGDKVFPLVVPDKDITGNQIKFPYIVMNRLSMTPSYTKDCVNDSSEVEVYIWHNSYSKGVDIAEKVRKALERVKATVNDVTVSFCRLQAADEGFDEVAYYQRLVFTFK